MYIFLFSSEAKKPPPPKKMDPTKFYKFKICSFMTSFLNTEIVALLGWLEVDCLARDCLGIGLVQAEVGEH